MKKSPIKAVRSVTRTGYAGLVNGIGELLEVARHATVRVTNALMTATYVEFEQGGKKRAEYGEELLKRLAADLTARCGRGFSRFNLARFRSFYLAFPPDKIRATLSLKSAESDGPDGGNNRASLSLESTRTFAGYVPPGDIARAFSLPWSHYVLLTRSARSAEALDFYQSLERVRSRI